MDVEAFRSLQKHVGQQYINQIVSDISSIRRQAENMVENATNIQGQGYSIFIQSRDTFMNSLDDIEKNYLSLFNYSSGPYD